MALNADAFLLLTSLIEVVEVVALVDLAGAMAEVLLRRTRRRHILAFEFHIFEIHPHYLCSVHTSSR